MGYEWDLPSGYVKTGFQSDFMGFYGVLMGYEWDVSSGYVKIAFENGH